jgi:hypothetical protein
LQHKFPGDKKKHFVDVNVAWNGHFDPRIRHRFMMNLKGDQIPGSDSFDQQTCHVHQVQVRNPLVGLQQPDLVQLPVQPDPNSILRKPSMSGLLDELRNL